MKVPTTPQKKCERWRSAGDGCSETLPEKSKYKLCLKCRLHNLRWKGRAPGVVMRRHEQLLGSLYRLSFHVPEKVTTIVRPQKRA